MIQIVTTTAFSFRNGVNMMVIVTVLSIATSPQASAARGLYSPLSTTSAPPNCFNGGKLNGTQCRCNSGFTGNRCETCIGFQCQNAGECSKGTATQFQCSCYAPTSGDYCEKTTTESSSSNLANNRKMFQCRSGENVTNYGNDAIWTRDICYDLQVNNVLIIDLGAQYRVQKVSLKKHGDQRVNLTIRVGLHLADQCNVMRGVTCMSNYEPWSSGTAKDLPCVESQIKPGRYVVIENKVNEKSIFCVMGVDGVAAFVTKRTGFFANAYPSSSLGVPSFFTKNTQSEIECARSCLQEPRCLNFRWADPNCYLYGGAISNLEFGSGIAKRLQVFNQTFH